MQRAFFPPCVAPTTSGPSGRRKPFSPAARETTGGRSSSTSMQTRRGSPRCSAARSTACTMSRTSLQTSSRQDEMTREAFVSVVAPVHNPGPFLETFVETTGMLLAREYRYYEIILVDDG